MMNHRTKSGFTLIELIVVVSIIGLLSTIGITGFQSVTRSGRDALRKTDLEQLRSALEIYKSEENHYPAEVDCSAEVELVPNYIDPWPVDPKPVHQYCYLSEGNQNYRLCAHLENDVDSDEYCNFANNCGGSCTYQVTNP